MTDALLDPFSTVVRLAMIPHMQGGVKVAIMGNAVRLHPNDLVHKAWRTIMSRVYQGYSRMAVLNLKLPIRRATEWYMSRETRKVFMLAATGLDCLLKTYQHDGDESSRAFVQLLATYGEAIRAALETVPEGLERSRARQDSTQDAFTEGELNSLRDAWTAREIHLVCEMVDMIEEDPSLRTARTNMIRQFVDSKHAQLLAIIHRRTESY